jgi:hypothetical protein
MLITSAACRYGTFTIPDKRNRETAVSCKVYQQNEYKPGNPNPHQL